MATINTDISQKVDIIIKAEDSLSLVLNITDSSSTALSLAEYYVFFDIKGSNTDDTMIGASNTTHRNSDLSLSISTSDYFNVVSGYTLDEPAAIIVTDVSGKIELSLSSIKTSITPGTYKYKMRLKKGTTIKTWMHGKFKVNE